MFDYLGSFIYQVMQHIRFVYEYFVGYQLNIDFNNDVMLGLFIVLYLICTIVIGKVIVAIVRWFYKI